MMRSLVDCAGRIYRSLLFLDNVLKFSSLQFNIVAPARPETLSGDVKEGLRFSDGTFVYPGMEQFALVNLALSLPAGRTTAVAGENGAGKSNLIKLLYRF